MTHSSDDVTYEKKGFCNRVCSQQCFGNCLQEAGVEIKARALIGNRCATSVAQDTSIALTVHVK